jgi:chorismate synthase
MDIYFSKAFKPVATIMSQPTIDKEGNTAEMQEKAVTILVWFPEPSLIVEAMAALEASRSFFEK